jgi:ATP-binding cassette subfamily F protein 3
MWNAASARCWWGPNGAGKSTLRENHEQVWSISRKASRKLGLIAKIGYFSQHRSATLDPAKNVLQEIMDAANGTLQENEARGILGSFLFRKEEIYKKTDV